VSSQQAERTDKPVKAGTLARQIIKPAEGEKDQAALTTAQNNLFLKAPDAIRPDSTAQDGTRVETKLNW